MTHALNRIGSIPMTTPWLVDPAITLQRRIDDMGDRIEHFTPALSALVDSLLAEGPTLVCLTCDETNLQGYGNTVAGHLVRREKGHVSVVGKWQGKRCTISVHLDTIQKIEAM